MAHWIVPDASLLQQLARALPDTIITKQVVTEPGWFTKVSGVASGLVSIVLLVLTAFLVPAAYSFRKSYSRVARLLDKVEGDITPITRHLSAIADNVEYITTSVRTDVQRVSTTLTRANEQLERAITESERRLSEFSALLAVAQQEAEHTFISAAAAVRGVRAGAASLGNDLPGDEDDAEPLDDYDPEELDDGDDDGVQAATRPQEPRIRPRRR